MDDEVEVGPRREDDPLDDTRTHEDGPASPARILISSTRKPVSYLNLAKRILQEHGEVQLSALGIAVAPMVTVAEILKGRRLAVEKRLTTSLESLSGEYRTRQKPKMEVLLVKSDVFEEALAKEALRFGTYDSGMASDQENDNSDGGEEDAGAVVEREGLPDGPEASAALSVAPMPARAGAEGPRRAGPYHD